MSIPTPHEHEHQQPHGRDAGPLADASVRRARQNDAPAVGLVQAVVFREAYAGRVPDDVVARFVPDAFARSWRESLAAPPGGIHRLLVACAGDQVVGLCAIGPSQDPDAGGATGEVTVLGVRPDARRQGHGSAAAQTPGSTCCARPGQDAVTVCAARRRRGHAGLRRRLGFRSGWGVPRPGRLARRRRAAGGSPVGEPAGRRTRRTRRTRQTCRARRGVVSLDAPLSPTRRREVVRQAWSVGVASGTYGVSFGALAVAAGLDIWQAQVLSLVMFTGGSQFAFVGIIAAGGLAAAPAAIATATMLGIRNGLYGLQTSQLLQVTGVKRLAAAQLTIDESTAVGIAQPEPSAQRLGFWQTGIAVFVLWNTSTLVGALLGNALGDPRRLGLDAAAAAAFVALLWPRLKSRDATATAVLAIAIALFTSPFLPAGVPVILATAAALIVGLRHPGRHEQPLEGGDGILPRSGPHPMSLWGAVLVACVLSFAVKLAGYLVPESVMAGERTQRVTTLLPVALLAALVVVQSVTGDAGSIVVDARLAAVGLAVVLLLLRANFLVIVLAAGALAAALRAMGWG